MILFLIFIYIIYLEMGMEFKKKYYGLIKLGFNRFFIWLIDYF